METIKRRAERKDKFMEGFGDNDLIEDFISSKKYSKDKQTYLAETPMYYYLEMLAPGLKDDDFDISVKSHVVSVCVKNEPSGKKTEKEAITGHQEFSRDERQFKLPDDADAVKTTAKYDKDKLMILVPKVNTFAEERPVHVKVM